MSANYENCCIEQGSPEWLQLRKTKITATDASIILGSNPWKTRFQLYLEKTSEANFSPLNPAMQRGIDLEPIARLHYTLLTGVHIEPKIVIKDWQMASLDGVGIDPDYGDHIIVEIKCPGASAHSLAINSKVPDYYYPQLQHQMHVCDVSQMHYYSFDGFSGALVCVIRDQPFIDRMNIVELEFYECLLKGEPPEMTDKDYQPMDGKTDWEDCVNRYVRCQKAMQDLEKELEFFRNQLIFMSDNQSSKGAGLTVSRVKTKGSIDYSKIPELANVDLDQYRKPASVRWRIS